MSEVYGTRPIKRKRRTQAELEELDTMLYYLAHEYKPATVRQMFYVAETNALVEKTEAGYKLVQRRLAIMRRARTMPFGWINDGARRVHGFVRYNDPEDFLKSVAGNYRRDYWLDSPVRVEIWLEKDAVRGSLFDTVVRECGLDLHIARGYSSISYLYEAAEEIKYDGRPTFVYILSDLDPSGVDLARNIEKDLREFSDDAEITVRRLTVTPEQVEMYDLASRPNKKSDSRTKEFAKKYGEYSYELESIPPDILRKTVKEAIEEHMNSRQLETLKLAEVEERKMIRNGITGLL